MRLANQKLKLFYLERIFREQTDEEHSLTVSELIEKLASFGISVERKTLYSDIECLQFAGLDIKVDRSRQNTYRLASREFELPELKLLTDAVQSSKFITEKKSRQLIKKLERQLSVHDARKIDKQVFICNRVKNKSETIYYAIDAINRAIATEKKLSFRYCEYGPDKTRRYRNDGSYYVVSPYALCWDDENYYMLSSRKGREGLSHFRVDKMEDTQVSEDPAEKCPAGFDPARYAKSVFGMFGGNEYFARLMFHQSLIGVAIDRFGADIPVVTAGEYFTTTVHVVASPVFFGWIFQLGDMAQIIDPPELRQSMKRHVAAVLGCYE